MATDPTSPLPPLAIIVSRYHGSITTRLLEGAVRVYFDAGGSRSTLGIIEAPGAFELPVLAAAAARSGLYRGVLTLGCIVRGETTHDRHIASAIAAGLTQIGIDTGIPVALGVLTVETIDQARARAGGDKGDKGAEAMLALLDTIRSLTAIERASASGDPAEATSAIDRIIATLGGHAEGSA